MSGTTIILGDSPETSDITNSNNKEIVIITPSVVNVAYSEIQNINGSMTVTVDMEDLSVNQKAEINAEGLEICNKLPTGDKMHHNKNNNHLVTVSTKAEQDIILKSENADSAITINGKTFKGQEKNGSQEKDNGTSMESSNNGREKKMTESERRPSVVVVDDQVNTSCCTSDKQRLEQLVVKKRAERAAEFARLKSQCRSESGDHKKILGLQWDELLQELQSRKLTATEVLEAYMTAALEATNQFNCVTDFNFSAFAIAKKLDSLDKPKGPLHGIPFAVKDDNNLEGLDTTHGYAKRLYNPASESAVIVKILMDLGAVPFCKTNVPQTLFTYGSDNPVFGTTLNATNKKLSPGGSSSGTGSLVGAHGALFGTGTDVGGSLRIPAHFNGVSSIKPTGGRCSVKGIEMSLPNLVGLCPVPGIIGRTPSIVADVFENYVVRNYSYDPLVPNIPWDSEAYNSTEKLRIGYFGSLEFFPAMGDTEETIMKAKSALESLGHTLVPFKLPDQYRYMNVLARFLLADHNRHFNQLWKGEKVAESVFLVWLSSFIPVWLQKILGGLMNSKMFPFMYSKRTAVFFGAGASSSTDLWDAEGEKAAILKEVLEEWENLHLDGVISPLFPFPAPPVSSPGLLPVAVVYAMIWNLVNFPAGMVPFGVESGKNINNYNDEGDVALKLAKKGIKDSINAPIGVQVIGLPFKEEVVLRIMKELEKVNSS